MSTTTTTTENTRLTETDAGKANWKKWGPYLTERQWGTVREDYSEDGNAWAYFPHDHARSRAYRWGEDGLGGISDDQQKLCFALCLWNGKDPILKERLFGLTNAEGNHGEDVKEYYFFLDSTPTHSWMKYLYKYPQAAFPYDEIVKKNKQRSRTEDEYELMDTGVFNSQRYFDVFVEYAKNDVDDLLIRITAVNRGPESAPLHLLPTLWFRNTWSWTKNAQRPSLKADPTGKSIEVQHPELGSYIMWCDGTPELLFTENDTNRERIFKTKNQTAYVKDAFHRYLIKHEQGAVNPQHTGTKAAAHYTLTIAPGASAQICLRLVKAEAEVSAPAFGNTFAAILEKRQGEADEFYRAIIPSGVNSDTALLMRQAYASMLWSKQFYYFDVHKWRTEQAEDPKASPVRHKPRNAEWIHLVNSDIISMPDTWEYPWYAAWDLAFHAIAFASIDPSFAKEQLRLMLTEHYLHPNGQIPAYEWNFGDVNPPVHAWATLYLYRIEQQRLGKGDVNFLRGNFHKLLLNFTWWINRKDAAGRNLFQGGFLGLDNIGVFDRSSPLPTGGSLEQADGTAWMVLYSQCMLEIAIELCQYDPIYEDMAYKFVEHFLWISSAMDRVGEHTDELWDEYDGFYYDVLRLPDGRAHRLKVRSMVGLLPLCAVTAVSAEAIKHAPKLVERVKQLLERNPELTANIAPINLGPKNTHLLCPLNEAKLRRVLARLLDENEFLSPYGIRSLSRVHETNPYVFHVGSNDYRVDYRPGESDTGMFGGNSNWRGPIWLPTNMLIIRALYHLHKHYGDDFTVECPHGSGKQMALHQVASEICSRLTSLFLRGADGTRPVFGECEIFQRDPHWKDYVLFYEYFHADTGKGIGASHQTGWTALVAPLIEHFEAIAPLRTVR